MRIVHVAFECAPLYKTGGLGDVVGSLPKTLLKAGLQTIVVLPKYDWIRHPKKLPKSSVPILWISSPLYTKKLLAPKSHQIARAYAYFALGTLGLLKHLNIVPDIIHCHDWHAALIPFLLKKRPDPFFASTKTLLTIHNIAYQGNFSIKDLDFTDTRPIYSLLDQRQHKFSFLKAGIENADAISTVSPHHAQEIKRGTTSFGLKAVIRARKGTVSGILNGIDYSVWNPAKDQALAQRYTKKTVLSGKAVNKVELQKQLGLRVDAKLPMFGFIARLSSQKGIELLLPILETLKTRPMQVVILGTGEKKYHHALSHFLRKESREWISVTFGFDETLAHRIYAAADFFLMPSLYEPCGLTQMISMAYGTIPIASDAGGLKDTITDNRNGFLFRTKTAAALNRAINRSLEVFADRQLFAVMIARAMHKDFSWAVSSRKYIKLYNEVIGDR